MKHIALAALLAFFTPLASQAQQVTNITGTPGSYEELYGEVRGWNVNSNGLSGARDAYCVAFRDETLRIGIGGDQWQLAVYISTYPDWIGQLVIDCRTSMASGTAADGWAIHWLSIGELDALMGGSSAFLDVGQESYDFSLSGMTASVLMLAECWELHTGRLPALP